jgi:hypothetical protein
MAKLRVDRGDVMRGDPFLLMRGVNRIQYTRAFGGMLAMSLVIGDMCTGR